MVGGSEERKMGMGGGVMPLSAPTPSSSSPGQEIENLKLQSQALAKQLEEIQQRIEELGKNNK